MEQLSGAGAYLLDNGRMLVLWLGHAVSPEFLSQVQHDPIHLRAHIAE